MYVLRHVRHKESASMRRATLLTMMVALVLALTAGVAVAQTINGTNGPNTLRGTNAADTINGRGGADEIYGRDGADMLKGNDAADRVYGMDGSDVISGGFGNDPALRGGAGNNEIEGNIGSDAVTGDAGDDTIRTVGDTSSDKVNCGEDADGQDVDTANVGSNDLMDGQQASTIVTTTGLSCELLFVDGIQIPQI